MPGDNETLYNILDQLVIIQQTQVDSLISIVGLLDSIQQSLVSIDTRIDDSNTYLAAIEVNTDRIP